MYLQIEKESIIKALKKAIAEKILLKQLLEKSSPAVEKIKHHKNVTKKIETELKTLGVYSNLENRYSLATTQRLEIYLDQADRIYREYPSGRDYFDNSSESIYFVDYPELLMNISKRIEGLGGEITKLENEKLNIDLVVSDAEKLKKIYELVSTYSYTVKKAIALS